MPLTGEYVPSTWDWVADQVATYERTGGQEANTLMDTGIPIVIITSLGASSGKLRKFALMRVEHDGEYALIASKGGDPAHPAWYHNLIAEPIVEIQDGTEPHDYRTEIVTGDERAAWWDRGVAIYPPYTEYQEKTDREIPVFVARRVD
jgi:deazaflavin-dependent oxidoreductase (nitroreductase family)